MPRRQSRSNQSNRHAGRYLLSVETIVRIEFEIIAGNLFVPGDVGDRPAGIGLAEIRVGFFRMVHETPIVGIKAPEPFALHMRPGIDAAKGFQVGRQLLDLSAGQDRVKALIKAPDGFAFGNRAVGENADAMNGAGFQIGRNHKHL